MDNYRKNIEKAFKNYYYPLILFANKFLYNKDVSKDIVQEIFTSLLEKNKLSQINDYKKYLFTAVKNRCINEFNTTKRNSERKGHTIELNGTLYSDPLEAAE